MFIAVLSDKPESRKQFCKLVGKETGSGDIAFYSSNFQGKIRTIIEPALYPDKLQPLLYSLSIADYVVLIADALTPQLGEIIVALDLLKKENGAIFSQTALPFKGTVLEKYEPMDSLEDVKKKVLSLNASGSPDAPLFALIDSSFTVKSVGNVALGAVKSGKMHKRDKPVHYPSKKEIEVKSIQLNDADSEEVSAGGRFGICYKGDLLERGILASSNSGISTKTSIMGTFSKSPFYKGEVPKRIHAYSNLQFVEGEVIGGELKLAKDLSFRSGERILITDPGNGKLRLCGVFVVSLS